MTRKICVVVNSRANYGRVKSVMQAARSHPGVELKLIVGASALLYRFGEVVNTIKSDGFEPDVQMYSIVEGEKPTTMAKSTGLAVIELSTHFDQMKPDIVLTVADRFDTLSTAVAASYMNIPVAHTQGGETTGSIDESVRHAITKLSHLHFPATPIARDNIIKMGEEPFRVHLTGCPAIDLLVDLDFNLPLKISTLSSGVGPEVFTDKPYILVLQHPVTTEYGEGFSQISQTLKAIHRISQEGMQVIWLWPNVDAGSDDISKGLRQYREENKPCKIHFMKNFTPEDYAKVLYRSKCVVGNSSSGLREAAFFGTPCVNIGSRQRGREKSKNVIDVPHSSDKIYSSINAQLNHGRYSPDYLYGDGTAGNKIVDILATADLVIQKRLCF